MKLDLTPKVCTRCHQAKLYYAFRYRKVRNRLDTVCIECQRAKDKKNYQLRAGVQVATNRRLRYGVTPQKFVEMLQEQKFRCLCCGDDLPAISKNVHIDHDHKTNAVRGIVCKNCNLMLAYGRDDPARLRAAADYLVRHATRMEYLNGKE
jgi:hypothetical protein